ATLVTAGTSTLSLHDALPICHLCGDLVESAEDVVGGEHDRLGGRLRVTAPRGKDRVPSDARRDAICVQYRLDRLAAACLQDPERSEEHTSELQSRFDLVCRLL